MNSIIPFSSTPASMSSREIAELANSRHDSVKRTIERIAKQGVIGLPPMVEYLDTLGRPAKEYVFYGKDGKRDSIIVIAQLSPEFTARLVDRWRELEAQAASPPPLPAMLEAAFHQVAHSFGVIEQRLTQTDDHLNQVDRRQNIMQEQTDRQLNALQKQIIELAKARRRPLAANPYQTDLNFSLLANPRGESKGGTHASPREHYRRGHFRQLSDGRVVEVKGHMVNQNKKEETLQ